MYKAAINSLIDSLSYLPSKHSGGDSFFFPASSQLDKKKVLLPLFIQALQRIAEPIRLITQMSVSYWTWCCKLHCQCKARQKQTSATSKLIGTKTPENNQKVMHTTLQQTLKQFYFGSLHFTSSNARKYNLQPTILQPTNQPLIQLHAYMHYTKEHIILHQSEHNIMICFLKTSCYHRALSCT